MHRPMNRVVIKLSGEALSSGTGESAFNDALIDGIAGQLKAAHKEGVQTSLVVGGGNFWRGKKSSKELDRSRSDQIGMLGTVMNGIYLAERFKKSGLDAVVMTPFVVGAFTVPFEKSLALSHMARGAVVINSGGTGHPYFSTDTVTALRAVELEADMVLYAKNVDGVYDKDPVKFPGAKKYRSIPYGKIIEDRLEAVDLAAMSISMEAGMDSFIFSLNTPSGIARACLQEAESITGTTVSVDIKEDFYV